MIRIFRLDIQIRMPTAYCRASTNNKAVAKVVDVLAAAWLKNRLPQQGAGQEEEK
jgi:hypothetical protein